MPKQSFLYTPYLLYRIFFFSTTTVLTLFLLSHKIPSSYQSAKRVLKIYTSIYFSLIFQYPLRSEPILIIFPLSRNLFTIRLIFLMLKEESILNSFAVIFGCSIYIFNTNFSSPFSSPLKLFPLFITLSNGNTALIKCSEI